MISREPLERSTPQLIAQSQQRAHALAQVEQVMRETTGTASDPQGTVQLTVDARGKLLGIWLSANVGQWGPERLGTLLVEVAQAAMDEATQASYNRLAPLLGDNLTAAIEQLSGRAAPARARDDDPSGGLTAEQFQQRRDERLRRTHRHGATTQDSGGAAGQDPAEDDIFAFDPSTLRSDR